MLHYDRCKKGARNKMKYDQITAELWICAKEQGFTHDFRTSHGHIFKDCMDWDWVCIMGDIAEVEAGE